MAIKYKNNNSSLVFIFSSKIFTWIMIGYKNIISSCRIVCINVRYQCKQYNNTRKPKGFWKSLENQKRDLLTSEEYAAILPVLDESLFEQVDYGPIILENRKMIRLPFQIV